MPEFKKHGWGENYTLDGDGFYISWLPSTKHIMGTRSRMFEGDDKGAGETALCNPGLKDEHQKWLILNGDFRKEYEEAFPGGYEACRAVYEANKDKKSMWSDDSRDEKFLPKLFENIMSEDE